VLLVVELDVVTAFRSTGPGEGRVVQEGGALDGAAWPEARGPGSMENVAIFNKQRCFPGPSAQHHLLARNEADSKVVDFVEVPP
jgi:hypothetical protein